MKQTNFEWPEFARDKDRIRFNSNKYSNKSISEAFADCYGLKLTSIKESVNEVPMDLKIGDVIWTKILNIAKNKVDFDSGNFKQHISSSVNLYKYDKFKKFLPLESVKARVTNVVKDRVVIDPISPMLEDYILPVINDPWIQNNLNGGSPITVKNLQLARGGFIGQAVIPNVSEFVGEDYTVEAFIPGSHIVLNITDDFESFIGTSVQTHIINYIQKPNTDNKMSLICSVKAYEKNLGNSFMIQSFKHWAEEDDEWKKIEDTTFNGVVTGVINSSKKVGVFVEIPELHVTGLVPCDPTEIVEYKPKQEVVCKIAGFEEPTEYNKDFDQIQHKVPYKITDNKIEECNINIILKFV